MIRIPSIFTRAYTFFPYTRLFLSIKSLGLFDVKVKLHPEVAFTVGVNVARSPDEAEMQKQGIDVIAAMFEEEQAAAAALALEPDSEDEIEEGTSPSEAVAEAGDAAADEAGEENEEA